VSPAAADPRDRGRDDPGNHHDRGRPGVHSRPRPPPRRQRRRGTCRDYIELLSPLLIVEETDLREGLRLYEEGTGFGSFDAVVTAATRAAGAEALVSADAGFSGIAAIHHLLPDAAGIRTLLSAGEE
jgi:hypothetical protein